VQTIVEDRLRGRVVAFYNLAFATLYPLGSLIAGQAAQKVGPVATVTGCAALTAAFAIAVWVAAPSVRALQ
jgi:fucose permease